MFYYTAFGISIESEIRFPELSNGPVGVADLTIVRGPVPRELEKPRSIGLRYQAALETLLLSVDGVAGFLAENGNRIVVEQYESATEDDVRLFLLGSVLGALLMQRGLFALHGSAVQFEGRAIAFVGESGIGKSTLASALVRKGLPLITDDLCMISTDGDLRVKPGYPQSKLWLDSLEQFGMEANCLRKVRPNLEKRALPWESGSFCSEECPLGRVYVLSRAEGSELELVDFSGAAKIAALQAGSYRPQFLEGLGLSGRHFQQMASVAQAIPIKLIARPPGPFSVDEMVNEIERDLMK